jgi:hypothetical protein
MAKKAIAFALIFCAFLGLTSCQDTQEQSVQSAPFEELGKTVSILDANLTVKSLEKISSIQFVDDKGKSGNRFPDVGMFYILKIDIEPTKNSVLDLSAVRYEIVDVKGQRYYTAKSDANQLYGSKLKLLPLTEYKNKPTTKIESFLVFDCSVGIQGITLELYKTDQSPERKLAVIDLKE